MESSNEKKNDCCLLYMFLIKLYNYEPGLFNLVLDFTTTITIKTNEDLQIKIDTFFKNCGEGYKTFGCISRWNVFAIKQIDVVFPRKYCCMTDGFKIGNWIYQQEPKIRYYSDFCYCKCYDTRTILIKFAQSAIQSYFRLEGHRQSAIQLSSRLEGHRQSAIQSYRPLEGFRDYRQSAIQLSSRLEGRRDYRQTRYIHNHHNNMSTVIVGKIGETPQSNDKNIKKQRDRITRYVNKTSPKIKSSKMQIGKR